MRRGHVREVANETNYTRVKKGGGQNENSMGRMCCSEEEINSREEAEMKQGGLGTKDELCRGVVIHTLVSLRRVFSEDWWKA